MPQNPRDAMRDVLPSFRQSPDGSAPAAPVARDLRGYPEVTRLHEGPVPGGYCERALDGVGHAIWQEFPDDPASRVAHVHFQHPYGHIVIAPVESEAAPIRQSTPETLRRIRAVHPSSKSCRWRRA